MDRWSSSVSRTSFAKLPQAGSSDGFGSITHPPANSPTSWGGKRFFGDEELVQWIRSYQPSMVISGHVHQSPFIADGSWFDRSAGTWVFNAGLQPGRPPVHIVLDIGNGTAFWLPLGSEQYIDLNAPLQRPAARSPILRSWLTSLGRIADPSWRDRYRRQVDHGLQNLADHRE